MKFVNKVIAVLLLMMVLLICYTPIHEKIHEQIMDYHGCKEVDVSYGLNGGSTTCLDPTHVATKEEIFLHSLNEIIGYHLIYFFLLYLTLKLR